MDERVEIYTKHTTIIDSEGVHRNRCLVKQDIIKSNVSSRDNDAHSDTAVVAEKSLLVGNAPTALVV